MNQIVKKAGNKRKTAVAEAVSGEVRFIPLSQLRLSPRNVRQGPVTGIEALAANILAQGILQNLVVTIPEVGVAEVEAGRRRLAALELLRDQGSIDAEYTVSCRVVSLEQAVEASLAENVMREEMHPADQYLAFKAMVDAGKPVEDVAAVFGVTPLVVARRLKLAAISPRLLADYRDGEVTLAQLMALTVSDDHALQEAAFYNVEGWRQQPHYLRKTLLERELDGTDALARFVTVEAFEQAGGMVKRDLFTAGEESVVLLDKGLLEKLAHEKLAALVPGIAAEGWLFVDVLPRIEDDLADYAQEYGEYCEPTAEEAARLEAIDQRVKELRPLIGAEENEGKKDALMVELNRLQEEAELIDEGLVTYSKEVISSTGVVLSVTDWGLPKLHRALAKDLNPPHGGDATDEPEPGTVDGADDDSADDDKAGVTSAAVTASDPARPALSEKLVMNLSSHYTAGLQVAVARHPQVALAVTVHTMLLRLLSRYYSDSSVRIRLERCSLMAEQLKEDGSPANASLATMLESWLKRLPKGTQSIFAALVAMPQDELVQLLAVCAAHGVNAVTSQERHRRADSLQLADAVQLDMREWWQATAAGYFNRVSKAVILEAVAEFAPDQLSSLQTLKKAELAAKAEQLAAGKGWLPTVLRTPAFAIEAEELVNDDEDEGEE